MACNTEYMLFKLSLFWVESRVDFNIDYMVLKLSLFWVTRVRSGTPTSRPTFLR